MKKRGLKITGILVVVFALVANLQYALFSYGIKGRHASLAALAQTGSNSDDPNDPWVYGMPNDVDGYDGDDPCSSCTNDGQERQLRQVRCLRVGTIIHFPIRESQLTLALGLRMKCKRMNSSTCDITKQTSCS